MNNLKYFLDIICMIFQKKPIGFQYERSTILCNEKESKVLRKKFKIINLITKIVKSNL